MSGSTVMAVARDGGIAARIENSRDQFQKALKAGGAWSPTARLWHWTGRTPYSEEEIPGLLLSSRLPQWQAEQPEHLMELLDIRDRISMPDQPKPYEECIRQMAPNLQPLIITAAAVALMMDTLRNTITAVFPDDTRIKIDYRHRPLDR